LQYEFISKNGYNKLQLFLIWAHIKKKRVQQIITFFALHKMCVPQKQTAETNSEPNFHFFIIFFFEAYSMRGPPVSFVTPCARGRVAHKR